MTERCPTCARPLAGDSLPERILAALVLAQGVPLRSGDLRKELGSTDALIHQATRRLKQRGAIRRANIAGLGDGWVLVDHKPVSPPLSPERLQELVDLVPQAVERGEVYNLRTLAVYLEREGMPEELRSRFVEEMVKGRVIQIDQASGAVIA